MHRREAGPVRLPVGCAVVDVQTGVVAEAYGRDGVVANIARLVERAREARVPVVWVQHDDEHLARGSEAWQIVPELMPVHGEARVEKHYGDAFEATTLEAELAARGSGRSWWSVRRPINASAGRSTVRGYDAVLVRDAHTTEDQTQWGAPQPEQVIAHTNLYRTYQTAPGRVAGTVATDEVDFAPAA
jgi:hypothetical protein